MRILITGGAGFVGRWFAKYCLDQGHDVIVVDNLTATGGGKSPKAWPLYDPSAYPNFRFFENDLRKFIESEDAAQPFNLVIHLAAVVGGRLSIENDPLAVAEDLAIDSMFWRWATASKPEHIITFSSSAAYPVSLQSNIGHTILDESDIDFESSLGVPDLTYGWAKLTNEYLGRLAHAKYGLNVACYRPFSGYGEDQDLTYPFPSICKRAVESKGSSEFAVWGSGKQGRDFIHIRDVVEGVMTTYSQISDGSAVNLSTGILTTFEELASLACKAVGYSPVVRGDTTKPEGVFARVGSTEKLHSMGFTPSIPLEEGIRRGVSYFAKELGIEIDR